MHSTSPRLPLSPLPLFLRSAVLASLLAASTAGAVDYFWDADGNNTTGTGGAGTWNTSNPAYWRTATVNGTLVRWSNSNFADDTAVFGGTAGTVTLGTGITVNSLRFLTKDYLIRSSTLTLARPNGAAVPTITVETGVVADAVTISSALAGSNGLAKAGSGTLILSGANTYTGATAINAGVLSARSAGALGTAANTANTTVANGAALELSGGVTLANTGTLVLNGTGAGLGALRSVNGNNTWNGSVSLASDATIVSATAGNTLFLASDYSTGETLSLGSRTLTFDGAGDIWVNENMGVAGDTGGVIKNGTGKLTYYGYRTYYTGATAVNAGSLDLLVGPISSGIYGINGPLTIGAGSSDPARAGSVSVNLRAASTKTYTNQISATSAVTINSDGILNIGAGTSTTLGSLTLNGGQVSITAGETLSPAGTITANTNSAHQTSLITGGALALAATGTTVNVARDTSRGSDLTITSQVTGTGALTKTGAGILTLGAANTYTGATTITGGTLAVNGSLASGSAVTVGTAGTLAGMGRVNGTVAVYGELAPGGFALDGTASIGTLTTGSQTWYDGASYAWQVNNTLGAAGTAYDTLVINGGLNLSNLSTKGFTLEVLGLNGTLAGAIANFDGTWSPTQYKSYTWTLLTASGGITGFEAGDFQIDLTGFTNAFDHDHGKFFVGIAGANGDSLTLTYESVPEPATYAALLGAATLGFVGVRRWRQRRAAAV